MRKSLICLLVSFFLITVSASGAFAQDTAKKGAKKAAKKEKVVEKKIPFPTDFAYSAGSGRSVTFSHRKHVEDFGFACDACHTKIFEVRRFAAREKGDFKMDSLNEGKYCGACHNGDTAFAASDFESCERCHIEGGADEAAYKPMKGPAEDLSFGEGDNVAVFKHAKHEALSCSDCHTKIFPLKLTKDIATMDDINNKKACGTCHNAQGMAFDASGDCGKCHPKM